MTSAKPVNFALITGAASGIGRAITELLLTRGAHVVALDRQPMPFKNSALSAFLVDITDASALQESAAAIYADFGHLDTLICNAGTGIHERLDQGDPAKWQAVIETNLLGNMRVARAFIPLMQRADTGATVEKISTDSRKDIVFISSISDQKPYPYGGAYVASKAGLSAVAKTLRLELMPDIRVSCVRPGLVDTGFFVASDDFKYSTPTPENISWSALAPADVAAAVEFIITRPPGVAISDLCIQAADEPR